jgi:hypothetical protein
MLAFQVPTELSTVRANTVVAIANVAKAKVNILFIVILLSELS